ncbi:oligodendrocyte-myelin glycoprotein [Sceloporus undulatus]|uniref:oligodendrocyte-myelin glycoprotein n=1 Tax=Sceloporus undulatus TaxID=8520 RepID=UPI001C4CCAFA|nr:oligodendrocyte-myelin glycoprotein [Sceloporus undulatus]XP_042298733.1 oligodendrocyte-myelin glycoprotein [Sceloporus undulatus]
MENLVLKAPPPCVLALLFILPAVQGVCPSACSCSGNDRNVDCSGRNLTTLPHGLQDNITYLNLSYNRLVDLDHQLTRFANLRTLDLAHNWLQNLPAHLPKSLWEIYAAHNNIRVLQKLDTAYQWNLKVLDVSRNMVERAVLINNTMSSLKFLNLSSNKLWTVPTNIPFNTETVDLSNNFLTQILPGTLMRLTRLSKLYLHNNKFTYIPDEAFDQLVQLQLITLYDNPWACGDGSKAALSYLQEWIGETSATVLGMPCSVEATTPWKRAMPYSAAPTAAENPLLVKAMKALHTAGPPVPTEQTGRVHQQLRTKGISLSATVGQTIAFTSTGRPLSFYPEGLSTEKLSSYEAAAATHSIYIQDTTSVNSSTTGLAGSPSTPMTLSIASGMPTNYTKRPQSTTPVKREESTKKINPRAPSKATVPERCLLVIVTLVTMALAMGYGFVLK